MDLPPELRVIHEPVRLRILGQLYRQTDVGFTALRDALGLTAGNLASHAAKLVQAGLVSERDALTRAGFEKRYQVTPKGITDFERYLSGLDAFLADARGPSPPQPMPEATNPLASAPSEPVASAGRKPSRSVLAAMAVGLVFVAGEVAQNALSNASGSSYVGIGVAGGLVAALAPLERLLRRVLR